MIESSGIPNLRHLRMAQVIGKNHGVSFAARLMNISQPAVTQAIAKLESDMGAAIFERRKTGTYPTTTGERFLLRVDRFFRVMEDAVSEVWVSSEKSPRGSVPPVERVMTATQVRSFLATTEPDTLEKAVLHLGVSQESLLRSARELEQSIGCPLFCQTARGLTVTKIGEQLTRQMRLAVREIEFARGEIGLANGEEEPEVVVGILPMGGSHQLAKAATKFLQDRPSGRLRLVAGNYNSLLYGLQNSRIDMIFGLLWRPNWVSDIVEEPLFRDTFCVVTRKGHPLSRLREITPDDLADYIWIVPAQGTPRRKHINQLFEGMERKPRYGIESSCLTTLRALICSSELVTVMARSEISTDAQIGLIESLPCKWLDSIQTKGITTRRDWLPTSVHEQFIECLRETTKTSPSELEGAVRSYKRKSFTKSSAS